MLYSRFIKNIKENHFINEGDTVLACVSGGADSICLFHLLNRYRQEFSFHLICAHVNHMLRDEAYADAQFVENLCKTYAVPFYLCTEDVYEYAKQKKISIELAGREVRYAFFGTVECNLIMTAHNKNDVVESMLLHFSRGCGLEGLCGIPSLRNEKICRPMLQFSKIEIISYLTEHGFNWREDISNTSVLYTRNKIRKEIIPRMEEINPSFLDAAYRTAEILSHENDFISANVPTVITHDFNGCSISLPLIKDLSLAIQRRIIHSVVSSFSDVNAVLNLISAKNGTKISLSDKKTAIREYDKIWIEYKPDIQLLYETKLPEKGSILYGDYRITVGEGSWKFPAGSYSVRTRQNGDYFYPEGMKGKKKIKDFFIENKIPKRMRDKIPLLILNEEIVAVGNFRKGQTNIRQNEPYINIKIEPVKGV